MPVEKRFSRPAVPPCLFNAHAKNPAVDVRRVFASSCGTPCRHLGGEGQDDGGVIHRTLQATSCSEILIETCRLKAVEDFGGTPFRTRRGGTTPCLRDQQGYPGAGPKRSSRKHSGVAA